MNEKVTKSEQNKSQNQMHNSEDIQVWYCKFCNTIRHKTDLQQTDKLHIYEGWTILQISYDFPHLFWYDGKNA